MEGAEQSIAQCDVSPLIYGMFDGYEWNLLEYGYCVFDVCQWNIRMDMMIS